MRSILIALFCAFSVVSFAQQQRPQPKITPGAAPASPVPDNSKPEPAGVYGYITVIDPTDGHKWVPWDRAAGGTGLSFHIKIIFRKKLDATQTTSIEGASGAPYFSTTHLALWYAVEFFQDAAAGSYPIRGDDFKIHYDPQQWRFVRVEMDPIDVDLRTSMSIDATRTHYHIPLSPTNLPFSEFPDFRGSRYGPSAATSR
jgi:hypothetical protein